MPFTKLVTGGLLNENFTSIILLKFQLSNNLFYCIKVELLEQAKEKNSIIFLGTGSGKTFIATMLMKHYMDDMLRYTSNQLTL